MVTKPKKRRTWKVKKKTKKPDKRKGIKSTGSRKRFVPGDAYPESVKLFTITPERAAALTRLMQGESARQIGADLGITDRAVREWHRQFKEVFFLNNEEAQAVFARMVGKSLAVLEAYLDGQGKDVGGDLRVAEMVLKAVQILPTTKHGISIDASRNTQINNDNRTAIVVTDKPNDEFAAGVPSILERVVRLLPPPESKTGTDS